MSNSLTMRNRASGVETEFCNRSIIPAKKNLRDALFPLLLLVSFCHCNLNRNFEIAMQVS